MYRHSSIQGNTGQHPPDAGSIPVHLRHVLTGGFGRDVEIGSELVRRSLTFADVRGRSPNAALNVTLRELAFGSEHGGPAMPRAPRGKRVLDAVSGSYTVVGRAPNGEAEPYFDRSRGVWVAPWRKPDGKVGRRQKPGEHNRVGANVEPRPLILENQNLCRRIYLATILVVDLDLEHASQMDRVVYLDLSDNGSGEHRITD